MLEVVSSQILGGAYAVRGKTGKRPVLGSGCRAGLFVN